MQLRPPATMVFIANTTIYSSSGMCREATYHVLARNGATRPSYPARSGRHFPHTHQHSCVRRCCHFPLPSRFRPPRYILSNRTAKKSEHAGRCSPSGQPFLLFSGRNAMQRCPLVLATVVNFADTQSTDAKRNIADCLSQSESVSNTGRRTVK